MSPRYELVDGELLVTPSPRLLHQDVVLALATDLVQSLKGNPIGHAVVSPSEVELEAEV